MKMKDERRTTMQRATLHFVTDLILLGLFLTLAGTGIYMKVGHHRPHGGPPVPMARSDFDGDADFDDALGPGEGRPPRPGGPPVWKEVHFWASVALMAGVVWHVILHWSWIVRYVRQTWTRGARLKTQPE
jgi:hypothetical protein